MSDERTKELIRMSKAQLRAEYDKVLSINNKRLVHGGPVTKDEYIRAILLEEAEQS